VDELDAAGADAGVEQRLVSAPLAPADPADIASTQSHDDIDEELNILLIKKRFNKTL
jgi:hypothetical protein